MKKLLFIAGLSLTIFSCKNDCAKSTPDLCEIMKENVEVATAQVGYQVKLIEESGKVLNPRTTYKNKIQYIPIDDWTSGFFPGSMWYMYQLTGDEKWKTLGTKYTEALDSVKHIKWHHDIGFMINCSYGNAYKVTQKPE